MEKLSLIPDNVSPPLAVSGGDGSRSDSDRTTKKVRFKGGIGEEDTEMVEDSGWSLKISWKDKLLGTNSGGIDVGRNIGYEALNNRISSLWNTAKPFHLMDIENGYFLAKFQSFDDYTKVLAQGLWMVYGQYLTVQPWTKEFCPSQPHPSLVLAWIRLPGLPGYLYKKKIIKVIGNTIGKVVRLDFNTDSRTRGRFARIAAYINLDRPLVAQVLTARVDPVAVEKRDDTATYGPWMVVERKSRRNSRNNGSIRTENKEEGKSGKEKDKGDKGIGADFQVKLKAIDFGKKQKLNFRDNGKNNRSSRMGGIILDNGLSNAIIADPDINKPVVGSTQRAADSNIDKRADDPKLPSVIQTSNPVNSSCQDLGFTHSDPGSSSKQLFISEFNYSDRGENNIEDVNTAFKTVVSVPEFTEVQIVNATEGLNSTKHTAVSIKEKKLADNSNTGKVSLQNFEVSKIRTTQKLTGGEDGGFRATRKINKVSYGKGNFFKIKNPSKIPLRDSMTKLA
ncbi:hypothetical protein PVK06_048293 [Gossypium arboreum]|uniref:DUF4283 domain-containing protein n=1 Tax=Gossypium arboreum TaxID=29729 RepID=A0ABR0MFJ5_GOSAR|nr:hypothetical protein PVK06_048293 [Gossypium arboreum]